MCDTRVLERRLFKCFQNSRRYCFCFILQGIPDSSVSQIDVVGSTHTESQVSQVEAVRKVYFAAIIVARIVPTEECLALVHELRIQLQYMLHKPTFGFDLNKEVHETKC